MSTDSEHYDGLLDDVPEKGVLRLRLNRPEARNALDLKLRQALAAQFSRAAADEAIRVVVVTGSETVFAAGADIKAMAGAGPMDMHRLGFHRLWKAIADFPKPVVAAVNGHALGGGFELALHADVIFAGRSASLGLPEVRLGIMPGAGGTQRLVRVVGKYRAMRLLLAGEILDAATAESWGLVSKLVDDDAVEREALAFASKLARGPAAALEHIKEVVLLGADLPLEAALALERKSMHMLFDTDDQTEGFAAFLEKRKPDYSGR